MVYDQQDKPDIIDQYQQITNSLNNGTSLDSFIRSGGLAYPSGLLGSAHQGFDITTNVDLEKDLITFEKQTNSKKIFS